MSGQPLEDGGLDAALCRQRLVFLQCAGQLPGLRRGDLRRFHGIKLLHAVQPVHGCGKIRQRIDLKIKGRLRQRGGFGSALRGGQAAVYRQRFRPGFFYRLPGPQGHVGALLRRDLGGGEGKNLGKFGFPCVDDLVSAGLLCGNLRHGRLGLFQRRLLFGGTGGGFNACPACFIGGLQRVPVLTDVILPVVSGEGLAQLLHCRIAFPDGVKVHHAAILGGQVAHGLAILILHRAVGAGAPAGKHFTGPVKLAVGQLHIGIVNGLGGLHAALAALGLVLDGVGIGSPLGIQVHLVSIPLFATQIAHLLAVSIGSAGAVRPGVPAGEGVAGTGEPGRGQLELLAVFTVQRIHAACTAVGRKTHGIAVGHPTGINGLAIAGDIFFSDGLGELAVVEPFRPLGAHNGILLQKILGIHLKAGHVGQNQGAQVVVAAHKAAVLQLGVMAHVQRSEPVVVDVQKAQLAQHAHIDLGELVVKGLDKHQLGVVAQIQAGEQVAPGIQLDQLRVAGKIDLGDLVPLEVQIDQAGAAGHVQRGELVFPHIQPFQQGQAQSQAGQPIGLGVQVL